VDFKRFSDLSMSFIIELPGIQLPPLYHQLAHYLLMDAWTPAAPLSQNDGVLFLEVSFSQATGQLAIETPQVPG
jgi:hypothetical protein